MGGDGCMVWVWVWVWVSECGVVWCGVVWCGVVREGSRGTQEVGKGIRWSSGSAVRVIMVGGCG